MRAVLDGAKLVDYFGLPLIVETEVTHLATDENGSVFAYRSEPYRSHSVWDVLKGSGDYVCSVNLEGVAWLDSLLEVQ